MSVNCLGRKISVARTRYGAMTTWFRLVQTAKLEPRPEEMRCGSQVRTQPIKPHPFCGALQTAKANLQSPSLGPPYPILLQ